MAESEPFVALTGSDDLGDKMKLYDFHCDQCGKDFEDLVRDVSDARCPACASASVTKQISTFSVGGRSGGERQSFGGGGCATGGCGLGGCGIA